MKIKDLSYGREITARFIPADPAESWQALQHKGGAPCRLREESGRIWIEAEEIQIDVDPASDRARTAMQDLLQHRDLALSYLLNIQDTSLTLGARVLPFGLILDQPLAFGLTDIIEEDIKKRYLKRAKNSEDITDWLTEQLIIDAQPQQALIVSQGKEIEGLKEAFRIHGKRIAVDVKRNEEEKLEIIRVLGNRKQAADESFPFILLHGKFSVQDLTVVGIIRGQVQQELTHILSSGESYIKLWTEYQRIEREQLENQARALGFQAYDQVEYKGPEKGYRFNLSRGDKESEWLKKLSMGTSLEAAPKLPAFITGQTASSDKKSRSFIGEVEQVGAEEYRLWIKPPKERDDIPPPVNGYLFLSLLGDKIRMDRQEKAAKRIRSGTGAMPQVSLLLEEKPVQVRKSRRIRPMTSALKQSLEFPLNRNQERALEIALNTPDIALIQGPPGTGKTQVISALCTRLVEEAKVQGIDPSRFILLTAFQHDAVSNAASRTRVLGLPTPKIGKKTDGIDLLDSWTIDTIEGIRASLDQWPEGTLRSQLKRVWQAYISYQQQGATFADWQVSMQALFEELSSHLSPSLCGRILQELHAAAPGNASKEDDFALEQLRKAARSIRLTAVAWEDDGPMQLRKFRRRLEKAGHTLLHETERLLDRLDDQEATPTEQEFTELQKIQNYWLDQTAAPSILDDATVPLASALDTYRDIIAELEEGIARSQEGVPATLETYLDDLDLDPIGAKEAIETYATVLAATVQGSDSLAVHQLMPNEDAFENVIVDEAARANPLDLFIALTKGKRRIILVGDHRQLPHLLEPQVEEALMDVATDKLSDEAKAQTLRSSLFERLFLHLKKQGEKDGIERVVTLNEQYRMHPVIGNFVSRTFYEKNLDTQIISRTNPDQLVHGIARYEGRQMAWEEVPIHMGEEQKGRSKSRPVEARMLVGLLKQMMDEAPDLSFGVITFYRGQVDEIMEAGAKQGLTQRGSAGWEIAPAYRQTGLNAEVQERLRIGTVDAFQGKEFDVVLLSTVRSNQIILDLKDERSVRQKYGFLTVENRLNVAMSRAKCLLVAVGDATMFKAPGAEHYVFGLSEFYRACHEPIKTS
jgi:DNA polymerase III delta prime subunit